MDAIFLKLDDIKGESQADGFKDQIEIMSYSHNVAMQVTTDAVQLLGGAGYTRDFPLERMMRDAKITQIYEGTNQVQRIVMARQLLKG